MSYVSLESKKKEVVFFYIFRELGIITNYIVRIVVFIFIAILTTPQPLYVSAVLSRMEFHTRHFISSILVDFSSSTCHATFQYISYLPSIQLSIIIFHYWSSHYSQPSLFYTWPCGLEDISVSIFFTYKMMLSVFLFTRAPIFISLLVLISSSTTHFWIP